MADPLDDVIAILHSLADGLVTAQAEALAAKHLAGEMMVDLALLHPEPVRYLTALYDRVAARTDPRVERPEKEALGLARELIDAIFRDSRAALP